MTSYHRANNRHRNSQHLSLLLPSSSPPSCSLAVIHAHVAACSDIQQLHSVPSAIDHSLSSRWAMFLPHNSKEESPQSPPKLDLRQPEHHTRPISGPSTNPQTRNIYCCCSSFSTRYLHLCTNVPITTLSSYISSKSTQNSDQYQTIAPAAFMESVKLRLLVDTLVSSSIFNCCMAWQSLVQLLVINDQNRPNSHKTISHKTIIMASSSYWGKVLSFIYSSKKYAFSIKTTFSG